MKPGVVTGSRYRELVAAAKAGRYALPAVNVVGSHSLNATLEAAAAARSDVIIQLSNGGAQFWAGKGLADVANAKVLGAVSAALQTHLLAEHYGVCVVLHTDHADRKHVAWVDGMMAWNERHFEATGSPLYSSHMLDLSAEPIEQNLAECERMLRRMAAVDVSLEIELGVTGGEEDGVGHDYDDSADNAHLYTQPEDVLQAYDRLASIGHFSVAASFGNVHGVYKPGNVELRPEILAASQALVQRQHNLGDNPLDLVFHGGSGSEKAQIKAAIEFGVFKMNIDTDTQFAFAQPVGDFVKANAKAFSFQIDPDDATPFKKHYDPRVWLRKAEQGMVTRLKEAFDDLGSAGRTIAN